MKIKRAIKKAVTTLTILTILAVAGYFLYPAFRSGEIQSSFQSVGGEIKDLFKTEPTDEELRKCEKLIFEKTNAERKAHGLYELTWDSELANIAREHSLDMAQNEFFSHVNLKGEDPTMRAIRHRYDVHKELGGGWYSEGLAENMGKMPTGDVIGVGYISNDPDSIAIAQVESWMNSLGHRGNILNSRYNKIGVGVAYDGHYYISTQDFY